MDHDPQAPIDSLPPRTTPTWEVEMLLSGALVFGLLQLSPLLGTALDGAIPQADETFVTALLLTYIYAQTAIYTLAATFVVHLLARAVWVALVGMHSVFPAGIRWAGLRNGPRYIGFVQRTTPPLADLIERADNRATLVFATGVMLAMLVLWSLVLVALTFSLSIAIAYFSPLSISIWTIFWLFFSLLFAPTLLLGLVDRATGRAHVPGARPHGFWSRGFALYVLLSGGRTLHTMMLAFTSNVGSRKGIAIVVGGMWLMLALASYGLESRRGRGTLLAPPDFVLAGSERDVAFEHYADQRAAARHSLAPFVQSDVIDGPYARLVIPYERRRIEPRLATDCPGAVEARAVAEARRTALLACLVALHAVELDGKPLPDGTRFDFHVEAQSGLRGIVTYVPLDGLARGRHALRLRRPEREPALRGRAQEGTAEQTHWHIAFWR